MSRGYIASGIRSADRQEFEQFKREFDAEEQAKRDAQLAPIKKIEDEVSRAHGKLIAAERSAVLNGRDEQAASLLSEPMKTAPWPGEDAVLAFHDKAIVEFIAQNPSYYPSAENGETITNYMTLNGIRLFDAPTLYAIYRRLDALGLMAHAPNEPEQQQHAPIEVQPEPLAQPVEEAFAGVDPLTGAPKVYTRFQVEMMDSETYRKAFRLPSKWQSDYEAARMGQ